MLIGRIVWGLSMLICSGINGTGFTLTSFIAGAFTNALPGIIVQIILVPIAVMMIQKIKPLKE